MSAEPRRFHRPDREEPRSPARLALSKVEAADALGVSVDYLEHHVMPDLRVVRRGRRRLIPVAELERWLDSQAERALDPPLPRRRHR